MASPEQLILGLSKSEFELGETLSFKDAWIVDPDGNDDLNRVEFIIRDSNGNLVDVDGDASERSDTHENFTNLDGTWSYFSDYELDLTAANGFAVGQTYTITAVVFDDEGNRSNVESVEFSVAAPVGNQDPKDLSFKLDQTTFKTTDTITLGESWVYDADGAGDISSIEFQLIGNGRTIDLSEVTTITPWDRDGNWGEFTGQSISIDVPADNPDTDEVEESAAGTYTLQATAYDNANPANESTVFSRQITLVDGEIDNNSPKGLYFTFGQESYSAGDALSFKEMWVEDPQGAGTIGSIDLTLTKLPATQGGQSENITIKDVTSQDLVGLAGGNWTYVDMAKYGNALSSLDAGDYTLTAIAYDAVPEGSSDQPNSSNTYSVDFTVAAAVGNQQPKDLSFKLPQTTFKTTDTITLGESWVYDADGAGDISSIEFQLIGNGRTIDLSEVTSITPWDRDGNWGEFTGESISINVPADNPDTTDVTETSAAGTYTLQATAYDNANPANESTVFSRQITLVDGEIDNNSPKGLYFTLAKDNFTTNETISFKELWVEDPQGANTIASVDFQLLDSNGAVINQISNDAVGVGATGDLTALAGTNWAFLKNGFSLSGLNAGTYKLQATAYDNTTPNANSSNTYTVDFTVAAAQENQPPEQLSFKLDQSVYAPTETLTFSEGFVYDADTYEDVASVDLKLMKGDEELYNTQITDLGKFDDNWAQFGGFTIDLSAIDADSNDGEDDIDPLTDGEYTIVATAYQNATSFSNEFTATFEIDDGGNKAPENLVITLDDDSYTLTEGDDYALFTQAFVYDEDGYDDIESINLTLKMPGGDTIDLNTTNPDGTTVDVSPIMDSYKAVSGQPGWGSFTDYEIKLDGLPSGEYSLTVTAADGEANAGYEEGFDNGTVTFDIAGYEVMQGTDDADTFELGDAFGKMYASNDVNDYALIKGFDKNEDTIQLSGEADDYTLKTIGSGDGLYRGTGIYDTNDDLIGIVEGVNRSDLLSSDDLDENVFDFV